jgi:diguanylate cyclase (GGDEF)-like protein
VPRRAIDDPDRLATLDRLAILDTPPEPAYDDIASLAAALCGSATAAVNFVDDERHWTKAFFGPGNHQGTSVSADLSFCAATIEAPGRRLAVADTHAEARWRDHPFVVGGPHVRFYAGAAIVVAGQPVGVVCAFGPEPRPPRAIEAGTAALEALARQASAQLELRRRNDELRRLAVTDPLTGVANRTLLFDRLELALAQRDRTGGDVGVVFCDVDEFKRVNDHFGHAIGDRLLCDVAECLRAAARETDTVARIAGDEFVLVCPGLTGPDDLDRVVGRVTAALGTAAVLPDGSPAPRLSVGAVVVAPGEDAASGLCRADAAMYRAKHGARHAPRRLLAAPAG